jgi:cytoskeleton protein RodZ
MRSTMTQVTHLTLGEEGGLNRKRIHLREISGDADTPLETVGQDLRAARLRRGDDLATVSRSLKIRKDHLEALEEDRFEALPGRTYAVGFVRSYADYLGLDPAQCVERFKGEIAGRTDTQPLVGPAPEADTVRLPHGWLLITLFVLIVAGYAVWQLVRSADTMLRQPVAPVPASIAPPPPAAEIVGRPTTATPPPAVAPTGSAAPHSAPPPASQGAAPSGVVAASPTGTTQGTAGSPPVAAAPQAAGQTAAAAAGTVAPATSLPPGEVYGTANRNARVVIRAYGPTRVLVLGADGSVFLNRMLKPGDTYRVPNRVGLTLTTPDGGAVALELDGQPMGYAGKPAQITDALSLDPQAIVDRTSHR